MFHGTKLGLFKWHKDRNFHEQMLHIDYLIWLIVAKLKDMGIPGLH